MPKFHIALLLACSLVIVANGIRVTTFRVYVHEYLSGANATLYEVARANITAASPTSFGLVSVADDLLTSGPSSETGILGRCQGLVVNSGLKESDIMLNLVFLFKNGNYQGSSINLSGLRQLSKTNTEFHIVGGTAAFRLARGFAISDIYSYDTRTQIIVFYFDFNIYLK